MRAAWVFLLLAAAVFPATAQNSAPPAPAPPTSDAQTHVAPEQAVKAATQAAQAKAAQAGAPAPNSTPTVLDSVVAIINGDVVLQSDVEEERRFESLQLLPTGENTDARAAEHLFTRTLILQQMKAQDQATPQVSDADLQKSLAELKKQLPGCRGVCGTDAGWAAFLAQRGMTPTEVAERWRERLVITDYFNMRFRSGLRVPEEEVQAYYDKNLVPQFESKHEKPPTIKALRPRIEEILLQQQVTKEIDDWENTLRQQGSVRILVPAYGQSSGSDDPSTDIAGAGGAGA